MYWWLRGRGDLDPTWLSVGSSSPGPSGFGDSLGACECVPKMSGQRKREGIKMLPCPSGRCFIYHLPPARICILWQTNLTKVTSYPPAICILFKWYIICCPVKFCSVLLFKFISLLAPILSHLFICHIL